MAYRLNFVLSTALGSSGRRVRILTVVKGAGLWRHIITARPDIMVKACYSEAT